MTKYVYGLKVEDMHPKENPWESLAIIQEALYQGNPVPQPYAKWLGDAIKESHQDLRRFLLSLGLKKPKGRPSQYNPDSWLYVGGLISQLQEQDDATPEEAITRALDTLAEKAPEGGELPDRRTLQRWRDTFLKKNRKAILEMLDEFED